MARKKLNSKDYNNFPKSKPFGYYPPAVDEAIVKYEASLSKAIARIRELENEKIQVVQENQHLQSELKSMHLQMASLELPEVSDAVTSFVLDEFKQSNIPQQELDKQWASPNPTMKSRDNSVKVGSTDDEGFTIVQ